MTCWNFNIKFKFNNAMTFLLQPPPPPLNTAPNVSSSSAPTTTIAKQQQMSWSLTEGLKDGLETQKCLEPSRNVYIYIYCGKYSTNAYLLYTTRTDGNNEDKWPHLHHIPMPSRWMGLEMHCISSPQFLFFSFITKNTDDKWGTGFKTSTCLEPWYVFNLLLFLIFYFY